MSFKWGVFLIALTIGAGVLFSVTTRVSKPTSSESQASAEQHASWTKEEYEYLRVTAQRLFDTNGEYTQEDIHACLPVVSSLFATKSRLTDALQQMTVNLIKYGGRGERAEKALKGFSSLVSECWKLRKQSSSLEK